MSDGSDLVRRFSKAVMSYNAELSGCNNGSLVQVWQPESYADGDTVLSTKELPFSISGVGDLLALYRVVSCKYVFHTHPSKANFHGAIGRAFRECQVEICSDVQYHDETVYRRIHEAQRCRIHSIVVLPVFLPQDLKKPVAVIEISHHEKDVHFSAIIRRMDACLRDAQLATMHVGEIDSLLCDRVGVRYQIYGPGRALAIAGTSNGQMLEQLPAPGNKLDVMKGPSEPQAEDALMDLMQPETSGPLDGIPHGSVISVSEVNGLVSAMAMDSMPTSAGKISLSQPLEQMPMRPGSAGESSMLVESVQKSLRKDYNAGTKQELKGWVEDSPGDSEMCGNNNHTGGQVMASASSGLSGDSGGTDGADSSGHRKHDNRLGGGAGKRLTYTDLQAQFAVGLKEAATRLGICPTTLKRACRRNGISRWPSRQIAKLNKAWSQMGYKGNPPAWLVKNAIAGNLKADNLAFALNTGLHMGLVHNSDCSQVVSQCTSSEIQSLSQGLSSFPSESCPATIGAMAPGDSHMLTMPSSASALNLASMDEGFLSEVNRACDQTSSGNHTWHAGQAASDLLAIGNFRATQPLDDNAIPQTLLVPSVSHPVSLDFMRISGDFGSPVTQSLECTQRGQDMMFDGFSDLPNLLVDSGNDGSNINGGNTASFRE